MDGLQNKLRAIANDYMSEINFIRNEETNTDKLEELAKSGNTLIVEAVPKNKHTLSSTLNKLSKDTSIQTLLNVANNPNTDEETLESMYGIQQHLWVNNVIQERLKDSHFFDYRAWNRGDYANSIVKLSKNNNIDATLEEKKSDTEITDKKTKTLFKRKIGEEEIIIKVDIDLKDQFTSTIKKCQMQSSSNVQLEKI